METPSSNEDDDFGFRDKFNSSGDDENNGGRKKCKSNF